MTDSYFFTDSDAFSLEGIQRVHFSESRKRITLVYFNGEINEFDGGADVFECFKEKLAAYGERPCFHSGRAESPVQRFLQAANN